ncbi:MAG: hypothetical protein K2F85_05235 [Helicobacter sp.]|nr:hypothetical protein [Helicobacter sp.]
MKKGFISLVAAAAISGIALADSSSTTELDLISIATQGAMSEQSAGIVALSEAEAAEVVGGVSIVVNGVATGKSPKPIGNIRGYAKGPLAGATVTVKKP